MKGSLLFAVASVTACIPTALGLFPPRPVPPPLDGNHESRLKVLSSSGTEAGQATFEQYIDHQKPGLGTFSQRFWWNATHWKGPGSPVIIFTPGELAADRYVPYITEEAITGVYAKEVGGAVILLEHRYFGKSSPYETQSTKNLQYLNMDQAVADFVRFARNVELPFDRSSRTNAPRAPWVWVGGSYSGALASYIEKLCPGTFWAHHSSSAPIQAIYYFWQYFKSLEEGLPRNCSVDFQAIIKHVDDTFLHGSPEEKLALKTQFGLQELDHDDDAAYGIGTPIYQWQGLQFYEGYSSLFQMCDAIQGYGPSDTVRATSPPTEKGVGLEKGLANYASWYTKSFLPTYCKDTYGYSDWEGAQCFDSYNTSKQTWHDYTSNNTFLRPYFWLLCNEPFFSYVSGAPPDVPLALFSRLVDPAYYGRQCGLMFPAEGDYTYGSAGGRRTAAGTNAHLGGWDFVNTTRLLRVDGQFDPWRSGSVSSDFRPGGPLASTPDRPVLVIEGSRHACEMLMSNDVYPPMKAAHEAEIKQMAAWVKEFYASRTPTEA